MMDYSKFEGTQPGNWSLGKIGDTVVSDQPSQSGRGADRDEHLEYYGGYLVAESILPSNRPLIAAAPDLLAENKTLKALLDEWLKTATTKGRKVTVALIQRTAEITEEE